MLKRCLILLSTFIIAISLSGCVYKMDIQQGNIVTAQQLKNIKKGMTRNQVIALLGEPLLANPFIPTQMAYVYSMKRGHDDTKVKRTIVYLYKGRVSHVKVF